MSDIKTTFTALGATVTVTSEKITDAEMEAAHDLPMVDKMHRITSIVIDQPPEHDELLDLFLPILSAQPTTFRRSTDDHPIVGGVRQMLPPSHGGTASRYGFFHMVRHEVYTEETETAGLVRRLTGAINALFPVGSLILVNNDGSFVPWYELGGMTRVPASILDAAERDDSNASG